MAIMMTNALKQSQILFGRVMHGRLFPAKNNFIYNIYYLNFPLSKINELPIAYNKFSALSFYDRDHGPCNGDNLEAWARGILEQYNFKETDGEIVLVCMPRIFGYVFNPVSFWLCHDKAGDLRAVLCEVHNTFGERHTYLCGHEDHRPIIPTDILKGEKVFHVSPFLRREGEYHFRFDTRPENFGVWIDYYNDDGDKQLVTSVKGKCQQMNPKTLQKAFWLYPLITLKAIVLIHWQALKLVIKRTKYVRKPIQKKEYVSATYNLRKD